MEEHPATPRDWDGATYDRIAAPMTRWGADVLDRLALRGDEMVLDAGCGSGRVTERLVQRLPSGRVIALDGSPSMLAAARQRLDRFGERVTYVVADLGSPLPLEPGAADAILSTATFHWVRDHDALFRNLGRVLRPGGRLVAQCGGAGNIATVRAAIAAAGEPWDGPWTFATPEQTRDRLAAAGFTDIETWLHEEPTALKPGEPLREYLGTVVLGSHLDRLPGHRRDAFVEAVAAGLPTPVIDYVRLNILAVRGPSATPLLQPAGRWVDGTIENQTAALLEPYLDVQGHATDNRGKDFPYPGVLREAVVRRDALGFHPHFRAIGDRAVRHALDAVEAALRAAGRTDG